MGSYQMKSVSLFSGAGGMDIGVLEAGFDVLACVEHDPNACDTLRHNIEREQRRTKVIEADIRDVDPTELMKSLRLKEGRLDLLFGGPPCQSFSQIGKQQGLEDERGLLLFQMVRFAEVFKPKSIVIENVKGLATAQGARGERGEIIRHLADALEELGYSVKWQGLTAEPARLLPVPPTYAHTRGFADVSALCNCGRGLAGSGYAATQERDYSR